MAMMAITTSSSINVNARRLGRHAKDMGGNITRQTAAAKPS
jgi:hypothetical protein